MKKVKRYLLTERQIKNIAKRIKGYAYELKHEYGDKKDWYTEAIEPLWTGVLMGLKEKAPVKKKPKGKDGEK